MHWSSIVCTRWDRRADWDQRNATGAHMNYHVPCPQCGAPNTKGARRYQVANNRYHWIRLRRLDTCQCVLTPMQDAFVLRSAKQEEKPISAASSIDNQHCSVL